METLEKGHLPLIGSTLANLQFCTHAIDSGLTAFLQGDNVAGSSAITVFPNWVGVL